MEALIHKKAYSKKLVKYTMNNPFLKLRISKENLFRLTTLMDWDYNPLPATRNPITNNYITIKIKFQKTSKIM